MTLTYAEIIEIFSENGMRMARVRIGRAIQKVPVELLTTIECGDTVLLCDGVALSKVERETNVPGYSR